MRRILAITVLLAGHVAGAEVFEPGPEAPGAVDAAAADVAAAVKLGKNTATKWDALFKFQAIARQHPAALHDCYLALAFLRVEDVTHAKLAWDRAAIRGGTRPAWCTGDLAHQLDKALADRYVELVLDVTPKDAVVAIDNVEVRNMTSVWLECLASCRDPESTTKHHVTIDAPGFVRDDRELRLAPPVTRVAVVLHPPPVEPPKVEPPVASADAGVPAAAPPPAPAPDAAIPVAPPPAPATEPATRTIAGTTVALGLGIVTAVGASVAGYMTHYYADRANSLYRSDPDFADAKSSYQAAGITAIACAGVSVASLVTYLVLALRHDDPQINLDPVPGAHGLVMGVGGHW